MTGRVIIVTGANSGIGFEVAKYLAEGGNDVILACRDSVKGDEAVARIKQIYRCSLVQCMQLDLSSLVSIKNFVNEFTRKKKLSVLINNAAIALSFKDLTPRVTSEGFELTMATNHLGPFLLTNMLRNYLVETARLYGDGHIVNVTCSIHDLENDWSAQNLAELDVSNFQLLKQNTFNGAQAYKNTKLCNVLFTYYLAESLRGQQVAVTSVDPGYVPTTHLNRNVGKLQRSMSICCFHNMLRCTHMTNTIRQAALQIVNLVTSKKYEGETGKFYRNGVEDRSSIESYDRDLQKSVWKESCKLVKYRHSCSVNEDFDDISLVNL